MPRCCRQCCVFAAVLLPRFPTRCNGCQVALPPSCHLCSQAGRRRCRTATAVLLLPALPMSRSCQAAASAAKLAAANAALPPPPTRHSCQAAALLPSWPLLPTLSSCQAATAATKLAAVPIMLPLHFCRCRRCLRFYCHCRCCHCCRFWFRRRCHHCF